MKIAYTGLDLPEGKTKYEDPQFMGLVEKFQPAKVTPYYFEFLSGDFAGADAIAVSEDTLLDLLLPDMELVETCLANCEDDVRRAVLDKCLAHLEDQRPLCDLDVTTDEFAIVNALDVQSWKPTKVYAGPSVDVGTVCREMMTKAGVMFFYTAGKQEVHAWFVEHRATAVVCAEKIHTDLARGFIKAEIISVEDMMAGAHSMQDARSKNLTRLVDRDHPIEENTILEIRFNV